MPAFDLEQEPYGVLALSQRPGNSAVVGMRQIAGDMFAPRNQVLIDRGASLYCNRSINPAFR